VSEVSEQKEEILQVRKKYFFCWFLSLKTKVFRTWGGKEAVAAAEVT
jgi:hypothetical protein